MDIIIDCKKEEQKKITSKKELADSILDRINGIEDMSDEDRSKMDARIMSKLEAGDKLSKKELDYLRRTNPIMYAHVMRVQRTAESVKERLKHARSKEEADKIVASAMTGLSKKDPDLKYIIAAVNKVSAEFHKTGAYDKLPNTMEDANRDKTNNTHKVEFTGTENREDDDGLSLMNWSPLTEEYDKMPTFSVGA